MRYYVITPARNEERYIGYTLASMCGQTLLPHKWIIVDDGSSDQTAALIDQAAQHHHWISPVHRTDRGFREAGRGVIQAFAAGYQMVKDKEWDFLVKLDADLSFEPNYFAACFARFETNARLGIGGGTIWIEQNGALIVESPTDPTFHVRGATKIYRAGCWRAIGGLIEAPGWDTLDEVKANMLGWQTCTFPELQLVQHRRTGGAYGTWRNAYKFGRASYVIGYHPLFMLGKCLIRIFRKPYVTGSACQGAGFLSGYLSHMPRSAEPQVVHYLRTQQLKRLLHQDSIWK